MAKNGQNKRKQKRFPLVSKRRQRQCKYKLQPKPKEEENGYNNNDKNDNNDNDDDIDIDNDNNDEDRISIISMTSSLTEKYEDQESGILASHAKILMDHESHFGSKCDIIAPNLNLFKNARERETSEEMQLHQESVLEDISILNSNPTKQIPMPMPMPEPDRTRFQRAKSKLPDNPNSNFTDQGRKNSNSNLNSKQNQKQNFNLNLNQNHNNGNGNVRNKRRPASPPKREENLLKVRTYWPGFPEKLLTVMRITETVDDTLFSALAAFKFKSESQVNSKSNLHSRIHPKRRRESGSEIPFNAIVEGATVIRKEMTDFVLNSFNQQNQNQKQNYRCGFNLNKEENSMWSKYCHHIYMQHQKSLKELRECDFNMEDEDLKRLIHGRGKQVYRKFLLDPKTQGSLLELAFASIKYNLNAIVVQFIRDKSQFYIYSINPQNRNKIYMLNVGKPETGKWRNLEFLPEYSDLPWKNPQNYMSNCASGNSNSAQNPFAAFAFLQTGVYTTEVSVPEKTILEISQIQTLNAMETFRRGSQCECTLQLFNRLLVGAANLTEFTFRMGNFNELLQQSSSRSQEYYGSGFEFGFGSGSRIKSIDLSHPDPNDVECKDQFNNSLDSSRFGSRKHEDEEDNDKHGHGYDYNNNNSTENEYMGDEADDGDDDDDDDDEDDYDNGNTNANASTSKFLMPPRNLEHRSIYAFKSIENMEDCRLWCESLTGRQDPKLVNVNIQNLNQNPISPFLNLQVQNPFHQNQNQSIFSPEKEGNRITNRNSSANASPSVPLNPSIINRINFEDQNTRNQDLNPNQNEIQIQIRNPIRIPANNISNVEVVDVDRQLDLDLELDFKYFDLPQSNANANANDNDNGINDEEEDFNVDVDANGYGKCQNIVKDQVQIISPPVQSTVLINEKFGSPQIILKFRSQSRLLQEAKHTLFLLPLLNAKIHFRLLNENTNKYGPVETKLSEFMLEEGSTFYLFNPTQNVVYVRCAWFTMIKTS